MKLGTQIKMGDGRVGTCVYNGLDGAGVKWGLHDPDPADFEGTIGGLEAIGIRGTTPPLDWPWLPEAMLRDPYPGADLPCVGRNFDVLRYGLEDAAAPLPVCGCAHAHALCGAYCHASASDQVPTEMADWPALAAMAPGKLVEVFGK